MPKLQDMFTQARRAQTGGSIGFLGKNRPESKAHSAALVAEFSSFTPGLAAKALKAGADGLLFSWNASDTTLLSSLKQEIESLESAKPSPTIGLRLTSGTEQLDRETIQQLKDLPIQYLILPFNAPVRLLAIERKEVEKVVTVPLRSGEMYPFYIRNLTALDGIAAVLLDFGQIENLGSLTIEQVLNLQAVREAVRFPAFYTINSSLSEGDARTLTAIGVQALILPASSNEATLTSELQTVLDTLVKVFEDDKDTTPNSSLPSPRK